jgi:hypothetical protein
MEFVFLLNWRRNGYARDINTAIKEQFRDRPEII